MRARLASGPTRPSRFSGTLAAAALMLAVACAAGSPTAVSLAHLATDEQAYLGETVQTVGTVRVFSKEDPSARHYVLEDDDQHRVALLPRQAAASFVGQRVEVVGRFDFSDTSGLRIRVDSIQPAGGVPSARTRARGLDPTT